MGKKSNFGQEKKPDNTLNNLNNKIKKLKEQKINPDNTEDIKTKIDAEIAQEKN